MKSCKTCELWDGEECTLKYHEAQYCKTVNYHSHKLKEEKSCWSCKWETKSGSYCALIRENIARSYYCIKQGDGWAYFKPKEKPLRKQEDCMGCYNLTINPDSYNPKGIKYDDGKARWDLLLNEHTSKAINEVIRVLEHGAEKYPAHNWVNVANEDKENIRYINAVYRHLDEWRNGNKKDIDSGRHPLAHAICGVMFQLSKELNNGK